jgi:hypothetical protein
MKKNIYQMLLLIATVIMTAACSSDNESVTPAANPGDVQTPIRITANYAGDNAQSNTRVAYSEDGANVTATWQSGDKLKVVFNGNVSTLNLESGVGETTATFSGSIIGTPTATSMLICYVADQNNNPSAVTINTDGSYTYAYGAFLSQDGTLAGAAKCNLYYGSTFYGTGSDISCDFAVNTSLMKFTVSAPAGVSAGDEATLTYKSNGTAISRATFTVGTEGMNIIYLTIPAGQYTGQQTLVYNSGATEDTEILSDTKANFEAGQTYSKTIYYGDPGVRIANLGTNSDYIGYVLAVNGKAYTSVSVANTYSTASAMIVYLGNKNGTDGESAFSDTYNHGLAVALTDANSSGGKVSQKVIWSQAVTGAAAYVTTRPSASSSWFLPSIYQWMRMLEGCGGISTFTPPLNNNYFTVSHGNFNTLLTNCGGTPANSTDQYNSAYWLNTEYASNNASAWTYDFFNTYCSWQSKTYEGRYVRPALAF